jgi:hypothetical protein
MFDLLRWRWEYEPIDLDGYIPDFVLRFKAGPVLVEVKPEFTVDALIDRASRKIDRSGWRSPNLNDALIVGAACELDNEWWETPGIGALRQVSDVVTPTFSGDELMGLGEPCETWDVGVWHTCAACRGPSMHHATQSWVCTVCGAYDGDHFLGSIGDGTIEACWREAGNAVRWKGSDR